MVFALANSIIESIKRKLGLDEKYYTVIQVWEKELGPLAKDAVLVGIKTGLLIVEVTSSVHFQELTVRRKEIINKINQHFAGQKIITGIKLRLKTK